jgi:hypothetical protein
VENLVSNILSRLATTRKPLIVGAIAALVVLAVAGSVIAAASPANRLLPKPHGDAEVQQALAAARVHPRPKTAPAARPVPQPPPTRRAGIVEMRQGPFPATEFAVRNFWQGQVGASWLLVYAGAKRNSDGLADQAAVRVYDETPDLHMTLVGTFPVNNGSRAVKIAGVNGNLVELQLDGESRAFFDLLTHQYR